MSPSCSSSVTADSVNQNFEERFEIRGPAPTLAARTDVAPWSDGLQEGYSYAASGYQPNDTPIGIQDGLSFVLVHLINFIDQVHVRGPSVDAETDEWRITIARCDGTKKALEDLETHGGYSFTHVARISRTDGGSFGFEDVLPVIEGLWYVLGFAAGARVGVALPVGFDAEGHALGVLQRASVADHFSGRFSWVDPLHVHDIGRLFPAWFRFQRDPFWSSVLRRAIGRCVTGHRADPLEESVVTVLGCLELLAWAILEVDAGWLDLPRDGTLTLAGRLRLLLRWAGIDPSIPSQLMALIGLANEDNNVIDGAAALTWVRNRSVHPPKLPKSGVPGWPSFERLHEAWRLALEYANLVILRLLGHTGEYGSLLHREGRWTGSMTPVPWTEPWRSRETRSVSAAEQPR